MEKFEAPKGTRDIHGKDFSLMSYIERQYERLLLLHGFSLLELPMFENAELFNRGVGSGSDIVNKEMYQFKDKGGRDIALRPEFTAGIVRALISNKLYTQAQPIKIGYFGPAFRYERPQAGRFRQFNQLGVEVFNQDTFFDTFEVLLLVKHLLNELDLDQKVEIVLNSLGGIEEMEIYRGALKKYFKTKHTKMCGDCAKRYETNILRILDCKNPEDRKTIEKAPKLHEFLTPEHLSQLDSLAGALKELGYSVRIDPYLVRGLDYYTGIVFEIRSKENDLAIGGGGQYANLVKELGGPDLKGVGMSIGLERLTTVFEKSLMESGFDIEAKVPQNFAILPLVDDMNIKLYTYNLLAHLREINYLSYVDVGSGGIGKKLGRAEKNNVQIAIIFGEDEINKQKVTVKNLKTGEQTEIPIDDNLVESLFNLHMASFNEEYQNNDEGIEEKNDEKKPV